MDGRNMENTTRMSLSDIPWPISILKCNQRLEEMRCGECLEITLDDPHTKDNLVMLLNALSDFTFELGRSGAGFLLMIRKLPT